jgi:predicted RNA binding protein YcfA (HicA-like mRNA interferase family)
MGRLAGLSYRETVRRLRALGFVFDRHAKGSHEIWWNPTTRKRTTLVNHPGDIPEGTLRGTLRQGGIEADEFLRIE